MTKKYWRGKPPEVCQVTGIQIKPVFIDGKTAIGTWAFMSPEGHAIAGVGLGIGLWQKYQRQPDGRWLKVGG